MTNTTLYKIAGGNVELPNVDPTGCEVVVWMLHDSVFFAEVKNGIIYIVEEGQLAPLLEHFPPHWTVGILMPSGVLARVYGQRPN